MKSRPLRNAFTIDCNCLFTTTIPPLPRETRFTARFLHEYIDLLADSGVNTVLMNPNGQVPWYPSKALAHVITGYRRDDREFVRGHYPSPDDSWFTPAMLERRMTESTGWLNRYLDLLEDGVDWLAEISKACRRRGISPQLSIRMNDRHGGNSWEKSFFNCPPQRDPRFRLSGRQINPRDGVAYGAMALNYEHSEVRDYMLTMLRELIQEYDFEGMELDGMVLYCEPPASPKACGIMTEWLAQVRELTRARARKTGRPYPLGLRIPSRLGLVKTFGLEVPELVRRGLIDQISPCNAWQTSWEIPYDRLRQELPGPIGIYGVIEDAPNWLEAVDPKTGKRSTRWLSLSAPLLRGNAAGKLAMGVDGLTCHNFFCSDDYLFFSDDYLTGAQPPTGLLARRQGDYPALRGLSDLEHLRGLPKHYTMSSALGPNAFPLVERSEQLPEAIEPDTKKSFALAMCREPLDHQLRLTVQVVVEKKENLPDIGVSFNGSWPNFEGTPTDELLFPNGIYTHHVPENSALNYSFDVDRIREGWNEILIFNGSHQRATATERIENSISVVSVELAVFHGGHSAQMERKRLVER